MKTYRVLAVILVVALLAPALSPAPSVRAQAPEPPTPPAQPKFQRPAQPSFAAGAATAADLQAPSGTAAAPSNDDFDHALEIADLPYGSSIDTTGATVAPDDPLMGCGSGTNGATVWYQVTPNLPAEVELHTYGSTYDTVLAVFTGVRGALAPVACNDDSDLGSFVAFLAEVGQTYYIEAASYDGAAGGLLSLSVAYTVLGAANPYLRAVTISDPTMSGAGRFVLGTSGGAPEIEGDEDKKLLYGFPDLIGTSFTTLRVESSDSIADYRLGEDIAPAGGPVLEGSILRTVWQAGGVHLVQRVYFASPPDTGRPDAAVIEYAITNSSGSALSAGVRIMLDTMIGDNDGAPFFVPSWGVLTTEHDFGSAAIPDYWTAWESPTFDPDGLKARGILRISGMTTPNRVVVAHWDSALCPGAGAGLYSSVWDYAPNPEISITCDSAVALFYNPVMLAPGQTRTIRAYYGLVAPNSGADLAPDVAALAGAARENLGDAAAAAFEVGEVGDYFLDKLGADQAQRVINLAFNALDLLTAGIKWSLVSRGTGYIFQPGYRAALHASWRGWADDAVAKHWYKPLYDAIHNNRRLVWEQVASAGALYYGKDTILAKVQEWLPAVLVPGDGSPFHDYLGAPARDLGNAYRDEIQREQNEMLALLAVTSLAPEQLTGYRADMQARRQANAWITDRLLSHHALLWDSYQDALADDASWWKFWGPLLAKWAVIGVCTLAWDGPGFYLSSIGTTAVQTIYDAASDTRAIKHDAKMEQQAFEFLNGRVSNLYMQVALNTVAAYNLIRAGDPPQIAHGSAAVTDMRSYGHYRLWPGLWWAEEASDLRVGITSSEAFTTTVLTDAAYDRESFWSGTQRLLPEGEALELGPIGAGTATIPFKSLDWGESPSDGFPVEVVVLGATETGIYPVASTEVSWDPARVEQSTGRPAGAPANATAEQADAAPTLPYPLSWNVAPVLGSLDHSITIDVENPFSITLSAAVEQTIPDGFTLLDAGEAQVQDDTLVWSVDLEPYAGKEVQARVRWGGALGSSTTLAGPQLTFWDPATSTGDTYTSPAKTVAAVWPLESSLDMAGQWQIGHTASVTLTLASLSPAPVQGQVAIDVTTPAGSPLWSGAEPFDLPGSGMAPVTLSLPVPSILGYVVVTGRLQAGGAERVAFEEVVWIEGTRLFIPFIARN
jgi:hypothetical protein